VATDDPSESLLEAMARLEEVAGAVDPEQASDEIETATLQVFWRDWPRLSAWAGAVWRLLNEDVALPARPVTDPEIEEVGGGD
jgi:hypothetical protein